MSEQNMVIHEVRCWRDDPAEAYLPDADDLGFALTNDMGGWGCEWDVNLVANEPRASIAERAVDAAIAFLTDEHDEDLNVNGLDARNRARLVNAVTNALMQS